jgi:hypothetical protein
VSDLEDADDAPSRSSPVTLKRSAARLDLVADFGDRTVRLPVSDTTPSVPLMI